MTTNERAFLDMLAWAEIGPEILRRSDNGYNVLAGSRPDMIITFSSYHRHPGTLIDMDGRPGGLESTAAGRYQVLRRNYDTYKAVLKLPDFSPTSQDAIAIQLIKECGALTDVQAGRFDDAVWKVRSRWASMPGANYNQPEKRLADLREAYRRAGGSIYR